MARKPPAIDSPWRTIDPARRYLAGPNGRVPGRRFIRKEVKAGRLRAAKVGGREQLVFHITWLDQYLEQLATPVEVFPAGRRAS